jgi:hypothetical protein
MFLISFTSLALIPVVFLLLVMGEITACIQVLHIGFGATEVIAVGTVIFFGSLASTFGETPLESVSFSIWAIVCGIGAVLGNYRSAAHVAMLVFFAVAAQLVATKSKYGIVIRSSLYRRIRSSFRMWRSKESRT